MNNPPSTPQVLTVSQLTSLIQGTLEETFPAVWVAGEISNLRRQTSGHVYLTLKDEHATMRGVVWKNTASRLRFDLQDGQQVICQGQIDVYAPHGSYQLVIRQIEPQGLGALQLAFRQLHARLAAEGLFEARWKKSLPRFPRRVAFVTSPSGAAVRDFLEVVRRRWPGAQILVIPARVQGTGAAEEIAAGIARANRLTEPPDVLVVGRGGGSLEDLWCFNEEVVVRAIFASQIPVVSAVGHEIDVTLADLVADVRALTPSEAAERVFPSADEIFAGLRSLRQRLSSGLRTRAVRARSQLNSLAQRRIFRKPFELIHERSRRLDDLQLRATRAVSVTHKRAFELLSSLAARLESLSPLGVLARGYSITTTLTSSEPLRSAESLGIGDEIISRLEQGVVQSRVTWVLDAESNETS